MYFIVLLAFFCLYSGVTAYGPPSAAEQTALLNIKSLSINSDSIAYVYLRDAATNDTNVYVFRPKVDDFSQFRMLNSSNVYRNTPNVQLWINYQGVSSSVQWVKQGDPDLFAAFLSVVVQLKDGVVSALNFDTGCSECSDNDCVAGNNCGLSQSSESDCASPEKCDYLVYFSFIGQDGGGDYCTSASLRPVNFKLWSVQPVFKSASGVADVGI